MPISSAIKGLQSIKSMQNVVKSGIPNKEDSDYIKLYVFEKERERLRTEEIRIYQRLEIIQKRLSEIRAFKTEKGKQIFTPEEMNLDNKGEEKSDFNTLSIDY